MSKINNYKASWICVIGSIPKNKLPFDCDKPMQLAVKKAYYQTTKSNDYTHFYSGWWFNDKTANLIMDIMALGNDDSKIKEIKKIVYSKGNDYEQAN